MTNVIQPSRNFPPRRDDPTLGDNQNRFTERWYQFFEKVSETVNETVNTLQESGEPPAQDVFVALIKRLKKQVDDFLALSMIITPPITYDKPIKSIENKLAEYDERVNYLIAKLKRIEAKNNDSLNMHEERMNMLLAKIKRVEIENNDLFNLVEC